MQLASKFVEKRNCNEPTTIIITSVCIWKEINVTENDCQQIKTIFESYVNMLNIEVQKVFWIEINMISTKKKHEASS